MQTGRQTLMCPASEIPLRTAVCQLILSGALARRGTQYWLPCLSGAGLLRQGGSGTLCSVGTWPVPYLEPVDGSCCTALGGSQLGAITQQTRCPDALQKTCIAHSTHSTSLSDPEEISGASATASTAISSFSGLCKQPALVL